MKWREIVLTAIVVLLLYRLFRQRIRIITGLLPKHPTKRFNRRSLSQIEQVVIHHSAGPAQQTPRQIARYHIGSNHVCADGCPGILYHYLIDRSGRAYQVNDLEAITYHAAGQNTRSVGICFIGNYNEYPPTDRQLRSLERIIDQVEKKVKRTLYRTTHQNTCGGCTECPGDYLQFKITA